MRKRGFQVERSNEDGVILPNSRQSGSPCTPSCRTHGRTRSRHLGSLDAYYSEIELSPLANPAGGDVFSGLEEAPRRLQPAIWGTTETGIRDFGRVRRPFAAPHRSHQATAGLRRGPKPRKFRDKFKDTGKPKYSSNINDLSVAEGVGFEPTMQLITTYSLSRGAPSATRPSLRRGTIVPARVRLGVLAVAGPACQRPPPIPALAAVPLASGATGKFSARRFTKY